MQILIYEMSIILFLKNIVKRQKSLKKFIFLIFSIK